MNEKIKKGTKRKITVAARRFHCDDVDRVADALKASRTRNDLCHAWFTILKVIISILNLLTFNRRFIKLFISVYLLLLFLFFIFILP